MAHEIRIPRLGWSMEEGTFVGWLKQDGDTIAEGDALFELEGEKAIEEIGAIDVGILRIPPDAPKPGTVVAVGSLVGYLLAAGETPPWLATSVASGAAAAVETKPAPNTRDPQRVAAAPSVRRRARELGVPLEAVIGSGVAGKVTHHDVETAVKSTTKAVSPLVRSMNDGTKVASPRARAVAREIGVDWRQLEGTGRGGRVRERDVRQTGGRHPSLSAGAVASGSPLVPGTSVPLTSRRKVIAARMRSSHQQIVPVTLTTVVDATNLVGLRNQFKAAAQGMVPAYTDIIASLVATTLTKHPMLAARWHTDQISLALPADDGYHIGIAVDTPDGLLVPVLRNVTHSSLREITHRSRELVERARSGRLPLAEMQGAVFTISTLGAFGVDAFTPIINYPETAILGLGAIKREAVVLSDDRIVPGDRMTLSLTFDHCATDGAPAASFLRDLAAAITNPAAILLG